MPSWKPKYVLMAILTAAHLTLGSTSARGQTVLERTPNLSGGWVGEPGVIQFNFLHRFDLVDSDGDDTGDKITNTPSFLLAVPLPKKTLLGLNYASNSLVAPAEFNEFELLARWAPLSGEGDLPLNAGITLAYNTGAESLDGELSLVLPLGRLTLLGAGRVLSDAYGAGRSRWAGGGGFTLRLHEGISLAGDVMALTDLEPGEDVAWGLGIQTRIPLTPHTFSLQATNTRTSTLQSSSLGRESGGDNKVLWGFEFTIPLTLSRYFGGEGAGEIHTASSEAEGVAAEVTMTNQLRYSRGTVRIQAGETVRWTNTTPLMHTVTGDPSRAVNPGESVALPEGADPFDSGELGPGEVFQHTFTVPGEYRYFCVPHEAAGMVGTVIVER